MASRKIEMTWRCSACDTENLGRFKVCPTCGDPKDASEKFEMPSNTRAAATVTDPALLAKARAGKDWACSRCGSNQSALMAACTQCGAARGDAAPPQSASAPAPPAPPPPPTAAEPGDRAAVTLALVGAGTFGGIATLGGGSALVAALVGVVVWQTLPTDVPATVHGYEWVRHVHVEQYGVQTHEGFVESEPSDAFDVVSLGSRHHHDEQVLDHYDTVHYTEQVLDGYDTRYTTEQEACGEDCTDNPETCSESCTTDDNGFADCVETCSGGGQSCTTRYCDHEVATQVARYRDEDRTRQDPVYRAEPRYAEYFTWHHNEWTPARDLDIAGSSFDLTLPAEKIAVAANERSSITGEYKVWLQAADGQSWWLKLDDPSAFAAYPPDSGHTVRTWRSGAFVVDPP